MNFFSHLNSTHLNVPNNFQIAKSHARLPTFLTSSVSIDGDGCLPSWKCLFYHWVLLYHFSLFSGSPFSALLDLLFFFPQPPDDCFFSPTDVCLLYLSFPCISFFNSFCFYRLPVLGNCFRGRSNLFPLSNKHTQAVFLKL